MKKFLLAVLCSAGVCVLANTCVAEQVVTNVTKLILPNPPIPTPGKAVVVTVQFPNKPGERIVEVTLLITSIKGEKVEKPKKGIKVVPPAPPIDAPKRGQGSAIAEGKKWDLRSETMDMRGPFKTESPGLAVLFRHKF